MGTSPPPDGSLPGAGSAQGRSAELWRSVDLLIDRGTIDGIVAHKLGPLAALRRRALGVPVPRQLLDEERAASFAMLSAAPLLRRIRELCDGPLVLLKGPELAALYPPGGRRFGDVDVLSPEADAVHRALRDGGFAEVEGVAFEPDEHHHLPPLRWPVIPLNVEVHSMPNWPPRAQPPPLGELIEAAVPSTLGIEGLTAPHPQHHALLLAAHGWRHEPLQTLRDLVDVAAISVGESTADVSRTARAWGIERIWRTTSLVIASLFFGAERPMPLRLWARHLEAVRERTLFESHLQRTLQAFWGFPPRAALAELGDAIRIELAPAEGETWNDKLRRLPRALRDARAPLSKRTEHR